MASEKDCDLIAGKFEMYVGIRVLARRDKLDDEEMEGKGEGSDHTTPLSL